eukprot:2630804-Rhodomonas_salina.3
MSALPSSMGQRQQHSLSYYGGIKGGAIAASPVITGITWGGVSDANPHASHTAATMCYVNTGHRRADVEMYALSVPDIA